MKKNVKSSSIEDFFASDVKVGDDYITADEMFHKNMYDYGMDVLEDRALADYRDGLKPAQRRLIWTANDLKATWDNKTVKSARITGDCMR